MEFYKGYESSTHQPLLKAVMSAYNPDFVLELGIGNFSTPILSKNGYMGIENNPEWIQLVRSFYPGLNLVLHKVDFSIFDRLDSLSGATKEGLTEYYTLVKSAIPEGISLLFVDNWTACRTIAINTLKDKFDFIIYHDCQPEGKAMYRYDLINSEGLKTKYLKSPTAWTAIMYRKELNLDIQPFIDEYLIQWPEAKPMIFTDEY